MLPPFDVLRPYVPVRAKKPLFIRTVGTQITSCVSTNLNGSEELPAISVSSPTVQPLPLPLQEPVVSSISNQPIGWVHQNFIDSRKPFVCTYWIASQRLSMNVSPTQTPVNATQRSLDSSISSQATRCVVQNVNGSQRPLETTYRFVRQILSKNVSAKPSQPLPESTEGPIGSAINNKATRCVTKTINRSQQPSVSTNKIFRQRLSMNVSTTPSPSLPVTIEGPVVTANSKQPSETTNWITIRGKSEKVSTPPKSLPSVSSEGPLVTSCVILNPQGSKQPSVSSPWIPIETLFSEQPTEHKPPIPMNLEGPEVSANSNQATDSVAQNINGSQQPSVSINRISRQRLSMNVSTTPSPSLPVTIEGPVVSANSNQATGSDQPSETTNWITIRRKSRNVSTPPKSLPSVTSEGPLVTSCVILNPQGSQQPSVSSAWIPRETLFSDQSTEHVPPLPVNIEGPVVRAFNKQDTGSVAQNINCSQQPRIPRQRPSSNMSQPSVTTKRSSVSSISNRATGSVAQNVNGIQRPSVSPNSIARQILSTNVSTTPSPPLLETIEGPEVSVSQKPSESTNRIARQRLSSNMSAPSVSLPTVTIKRPFVSSSSKRVTGSVAQNVNGSQQSSVSTNRIFTQRPSSNMSAPPVSLPLVTRESLLASAIRKRANGSQQPSVSTNSIARQILSTNVSTTPSPPLLETIDGPEVSVSQKPSVSTHRSVKQRLSSNMSAPPVSLPSVTTKSPLVSSSSKLATGSVARNVNGSQQSSVSTNRIARQRLSRTMSAPPVFLPLVTRESLLANSISKRATGSVGQNLNGSQQPSVSINRIPGKRPSSNMSTPPVSLPLVTIESLLARAIRKGATGSVAQSLNGSQQPSVSTNRIPGKRPSSNMSTPPVSLPLVTIESLLARATGSVDQNLNGSQQPSVSTNRIPGKRPSSNMSTPPVSLPLVTIESLLARATGSVDQNLNGSQQPSVSTNRIPGKRPSSNMSAPPVPRESPLVSSISNSPTGSVGQHVNGSQPASGSINCIARQILSTDACTTLSPPLPVTIEGPLVSAISNQATGSVPQNVNGNPLPSVSSNWISTQTRSSKVSEPTVSLPSVTIKRPLVSSISNNATGSVSPNVNGSQQASVCDNCIAGQILSTHVSTTPSAPLPITIEGPMFTAISNQATGSVDQNVNGSQQPSVSINYIARQTLSMDAYTAPSPPLPITIEGPVVSAISNQATGSVPQNVNGNPLPSVSTNTIARQSLSSNISAPPESLPSMNITSPLVSSTSYPDTHCVVVLKASQPFVSSPGIRRETSSSKLSIPHVPTLPVTTEGPVVSTISNLATGSLAQNVNASMQPSVSSSWISRKRQLLGVSPPLVPPPCQRQRLSINASTLPLSLPSATTEGPSASSLSNQATRCVAQNVNESQQPSESTNWTARQIVSTNASTTPPVQATIEGPCVSSMSNPAIGCVAQNVNVSLQPSVSFQGIASQIPATQQQETNHEALTQQILDTTTQSTGQLTQDICMFREKGSPDGATNLLEWRPMGANRAEMLSKVNVDPQSPADSENEKAETPTLSFSKMQKLFGATCSLCDQGTDCSCILAFRVALEQLNDRDLTKCLEYMFAHSQLFTRFFKSFCEHYGGRGNVSKLLALFRRCEEYKDGARYVFIIYRNLANCYASNRQACRAMLEAIRNETLPYVKVLVDIIIDAGWVPFKNFLFRFLRIPGFRLDFVKCKAMVPSVLQERDYDVTLCFLQCFSTLQKHEKLVLMDYPDVQAAMKLCSYVAAAYSPNIMGATIKSSTENIIHE